MTHLSCKSWLRKFLVLAHALIVATNFPKPAMIFPNFSLQISLGAFLVSMGIFRVMLNFATLLNMHVSVNCLAVSVPLNPQLNIIINFARWMSKSTFLNRSYD